MHLYLIENWLIENNFFFLFYSRVHPLPKNSGCHRTKKRRKKIILNAHVNCNTHRMNLGHWLCVEMNPSIKFSKSQCQCVASYSGNFQHILNLNKINSQVISISGNEFMGFPLEQLTNDADGVKERRLASKKKPKRETFRKVPWHPNLHMLNTRKP